LEENQNTSEELQPQALPDAQVKDHSENAAPETPAAFPEIKEETPTLSTQPQTSNIEPQTINHKQETAEMEVHKHPHHVMHKKKWNEYLLEFFMLFLAVFLGFIAENIREHYAEKKHEKEFALQLSEGLQQDTASLSFILRANKIEKADYDSLLLFVALPDNEEKWKGIYRHIENINGSPQFVSHQVSIEQVQNIGALRYFKNKDIVKQIAEYKYWIGLLNYQQNNYTQFCNSELEPFLLSHFNENQVPQRFETHVSNIDASQSTIPSFISNAEDSRFFQNLVIQGREKLLLPQGNLKKMKDRAIELIQLLDKEYHFKNE
jgi:hypothetical protein